MLFTHDLENWIINERAYLENWKIDREIESAIAIEAESEDQKLKLRL